MYKLSIPDDDKEYLAELLSVKPEARDAFLESIEDPNNINKLSDFARQFQEKTGVDKEIADDIMRILLTIYNAYDASGESIETFVSALVNSFKEIVGKDVKDTTDQDYQLFRDFFVNLLSLHNTLGVRAKAFRLIPEHQHLFIRSELYSDIRPIFKPDDPTVKPSAAVIVHSLKIIYRDSIGTREIFIGLDDEDLQQLKIIIDRAISKHECLKSMISDLGIQCLGLEREE